MFCCEIDSEIGEYIHAMGKGRFNVDSEILGEVSKENESGMTGSILHHSKFLWRQHFTLVDQGFCQLRVTYSFYLSMSCYILRVLDDRF